ncbi:alanine racemase [Olsenella sp. YH-ols2217]|uniref:Alanine racemase n=2 Tax=Kribbibacterium absianum TaxID=3044210 RepID=A0ABT6ZLQ7_9ACTN|nr:MULTISPECIES: alanine racemase [unclassified Olsenella]MDJ1122562.1 alanine racemase [Olsenella sp. YH-ols2216]MDJ1129478.1 alanine racemase [Olsenella sp. YH-ols2217]
MADMVENCPDDRWAWVEIDRGALRRNVRTFKSRLEPGVQLMAVVKADAYGHGAAACAPVMRSAGADQFAVATVAEGRALRESGIAEPILVLSQPPVTSIPDLIEYDLMPSVFDVSFGLAYGEAAAQAGKVGRYHVAIDTGMTRTGVDWRDVIDVRDQLEFHRGLQCAGTFTHFATADVPGDWDWELQRHRFDEAVAGLRDAGLDPGLVHCDNTPATVLHAETHYDMVRVGVGLYGLQPCDATVPHLSLDPVMSVRARVTRAVYPPVGAGVSYGMKWRVTKGNLQVATVPVGYADGYSRALSGKVDVLCRGQRLPQVGNICMDQFMFAVEVNTARQYKPVRPVQEGDVVTLVGRDGDESITADDLAALLGTINYEVVCDFGLRLEKVYR